MEKAKILEILNEKCYGIMDEGKYYVVDEFGTTRVGMMARDLIFTVVFLDNMKKNGEIKGENVIVKVIKLDKANGCNTAEEIEIVPQEEIDRVERKLGAGQIL